MDDESRVNKLSPSSDRKSELSDVIDTHSSADTASSSSVSIVFVTGEAIGDIPAGVGSAVATFPISTNRS